METELEYKLANSNKADLIAFISFTPNAFGELVALALSDRHPYNWKAAWLISCIIHTNDNRVQPFVNQIINKMPVKQESMNRLYLMILHKMKIDVNSEGKLFAICMTIWENTKTMQSIRYHAMKMMLSIAKKYPELQNDIAFLLEEHYLETFTKGIKHSLKLLLKDAHKH